MLDIVSTGRRASGFSRRGKKQRWTAAAVCLALVAGLAACGTSAQTGSQSTPDRSAEPPADVTPPQLLGLADMTVAVGETVYYREGISALDDVDGEVPFMVDAAAVDLTAPGEYPVVYSAQDTAGNRVEQSITLTVIETITVDQDIQEPEEDDPSAPSSGGGISLDQVTQADVDRLADQILAKITRSGMSQRDKAKAIFDYVNKHIKYVGTSDKSSWIIGAYVGFTRGRGDCYNYFACSKALLTRAGISNVDLRRVGGASRHYWQLVNCGDGWYHFDTCPHPNGHALYSFMITETRARAFTQELQDAGVRTNYYVYDYASCPVRAVGMPEEVPSPPPDSSQVPENPDGSQAPENPDGSQVPENPGGSQVPENPGGSQVPENPGDSQVPENPDGSQVPENPGGSQVPENPGGSQVPENPGGSQAPENPGGSQAPENPDSSQPEQTTEGENPVAA